MRRMHLSVNVNSLFNRRVELHWQMSARLCCQQYGLIAQRFDINFITSAVFVRKDLFWSSSHHTPTTPVCAPNELPTSGDRNTAEIDPGTTAVWNLRLFQKTPWNLACFPSKMAPKRWCVKRYR